MYEPEIHINEDLMESLTLEEKREWVESSPTPVFNVDPVTQQAFNDLLQVSDFYNLSKSSLQIYVLYVFVKLSQRNMGVLIQHVCLPFSINQYNRSGFNFIFIYLKIPAH